MDDVLKVNDDSASNQHLKRKLSTTAETSLNVIPPRKIVLGVVDATNIKCTNVNRKRRWDQGPEVSDADGIYPVKKQCIEQTDVKELSTTDEVQNEYFGSSNQNISDHIFNDAVAPETSEQTLNSECGSSSEIHIENKKNCETVSSDDQKLSHSPQNDKSLPLSNIDSYNDYDQLDESKCDLEMKNSSKIMEIIHTNTPYSESLRVDPDLSDKSSKHPKKECNVQPALSKSCETVVLKRPILLVPDYGSESSDSESEVEPTSESIKLTLVETDQVSQRQEVTVIQELKEDAFKDISLINNETSDNEKSNIPKGVTFSGTIQENELDIDTRTADSILSECINVSTNESSGNEQSQDVKISDSILWGQDSSDKCNTGSSSTCLDEGKTFDESGSKPSEMYGSEKNGLVIEETIFIEGLKSTESQFDKDGLSNVSINKEKDVLLSNNRDDQLLAKSESMSSDSILIDKSNMDMNKELMEPSGSNDGSLSEGISDMNVNNKMVEITSDQDDIDETEIIDNDVDKDSVDALERNPITMSSADNVDPAVMEIIFGIQSKPLTVSNSKEAYPTLQSPRPTVEIAEVQKTDEESRETTDDTNDCIDVSDIELAKRVVLGDDEPFFNLDSKSDFESPVQQTVVNEKRAFPIDSTEVVTVDPNKPLMSEEVLLCTITNTKNFDSPTERKSDETIQSDKSELVDDLKEAHSCDMNNFEPKHTADLNSEELSFGSCDLIDVRKLSSSSTQPSEIMETPTNESGAQETINFSDLSDIDSNANNSEIECENTVEACGLVQENKSELEEEVDIDMKESYKGTTDLNTIKKIKDKEETCISDDSVLDIKTVEDTDLEGIDNLSEDRGSAVEENNSDTMQPGIIHDSKLDEFMCADYSDSESLNKCGKMFEIDTDSNSKISDIEQALDAFIGDTGRDEIPCKQESILRPFETDNELKKTVKQSDSVVLHSEMNDIVGNSTCDFKISPSDETESKELLKQEYDFESEPHVKSEDKEVDLDKVTENSGEDDLIEISPENDTTNGVIRTEDFADCEAAIESEDSMKSGVSLSRLINVEEQQETSSEEAKEFSLDETEGIVQQNYVEEVEASEDMKCSIKDESENIIDLYSERDKTPASGVEEDSETNICEVESEKVLCSKNEKDVSETSVECLIGDAVKVDSVALKYKSDGDTDGVFENNKLEAENMDVDTICDKEQSAFHSRDNDGTNIICTDVLKFNETISVPMEQEDNEICKSKASQEVVFETLNETTVVEKLNKDEVLDINDDNKFKNKSYTSKQDKVNERMSSDDSKKCNIGDPTMKLSDQENLLLVNDSSPKKEPIVVGDEMDATKDESDVSVKSKCVKTIVSCDVVDATVSMNITSVQAQSKCFDLGEGAEIKKSEDGNIGSDHFEFEHSDQISDEVENDASNTTDRIKIISGIQSDNDPSSSKNVSPDNSLSLSSDLKENISSEESKEIVPPEGSKITEEIESEIEIVCEDSTDSEENDILTENVNFGKNSSVGEEKIEDTIEDDSQKEIVNRGTSIQKEDGSLSITTHKIVQNKLEEETEKLAELAFPVNEIEALSGSSEKKVNTTESKVNLENPPVSCDIDLIEDKSGADNIKDSLDPVMTLEPKMSERETNILEHLASDETKNDKKSNITPNIETENICNVTAPLSPAGKNDEGLGPCDAEKTLLQDIENSEGAPKNSNTIPDLVIDDKLSVKDFISNKDLEKNIAVVEDKGTKELIDSSFEPMDIDSRKEKASESEIDCNTDDLDLEMDCITEDVDGNSISSLEEKENDLGSQHHIIVGSNNRSSENEQKSNFKLNEIEQNKIFGKMDSGSKSRMKGDADKFEKSSELNDTQGLLDSKCVTLSGSKQINVNKKQYQGKGIEICEGNSAKHDYVLKFSDQDTRNEPKIVSPLKIKLSSQSVVDIGNAEEMTDSLIVSPGKIVDVKSSPITEVNLKELNVNLKNEQKNVKDVSQHNDVPLLSTVTSTLSAEARKTESLKVNSISLNPELPATSVLRKSLMSETQQPKLEPITLRIYKDNLTVRTDGLDSPKRIRSPKLNSTSELKSQLSPHIKLNEIKNPLSPQSKQLEFTLKIAKDSTTNYPKATMSPKSSSSSSSGSWKATDFTRVEKILKESNVSITPIVSSPSSPDPKMNKITLKLPKDGGHPEIKPQGDNILPRSPNSEVTITRKERISEMASEKNGPPDKKPKLESTSSPIKYRNIEQVQRAMVKNDHDKTDEVEIIKIIESSTKDLSPAMCTPKTPILVQPVVTQKKRGRPRKVIVPPIPILNLSNTENNGMDGQSFPVPLFDLTEGGSIEHTSSEFDPATNRPMRSCRGRTKPIVVRTRKPRGGGILRGGGRGRGMKRQLAADLESLSAYELAELAKIEARREKLKADRIAKKEAKQAKVLAKKLKDEERRKRIAKEKAEAQALAVLEEETRMSAPENSRMLTPGRVNLSGNVSNEFDIKDESQGSVSNAFNKKGRMEIPIDLECKEIRVEQLAEYQWQGSELYMIQEQISLYLGVKSFKRKYPNLKRRGVEAEERTFLEESGLVPKSMCDLGLTAVSSAEVCDVMFQDFPDKYEEFRKHVREKQAREASWKQKVALASWRRDDKFKAEPREQALESAAVWNANLNRERREDRRCALDLQTFSVHYPKSRHQAMTRPVPKVGTYPVALIPSQYCDYYKEYTSAELMYFPLNTVLYGPMRPNERQNIKTSVASQSDSEESSSSEDSSDSSSEGSDVTSDTEDDTKCKVCSGTKKTNKQGQAEVLIQCAQCSSSVHPTCQDLTVEMVPHIKKYNWQCTDCKNCIQCKDPANEDKMLFCDLCDRGYHIYCVGLHKVPDGRWHCTECSVCSSCETRDPGGPDWQHEYKKGEKGTKTYLRTLCVTCSRLWRKGKYCQLCLKCHSLKPEEEAGLQQCNTCDRWIHKECYSVRVGTTSKILNNGFQCDLCQERVQTAINNSAGNRPLIKV